MTASLLFHCRLGFLKDLFLVHFYSFCILHLLVASFLILTLIIISADDTQLYIALSATNFSDKISQLETTISSVQNRMTSNFLSLNPSKTDFLLRRLLFQLAKLQNPRIFLLATLYSVPFETLVLSLTPIRLFLNMSRLFLNLNFNMFVIFGEFEIPLIFQLLAPLPLLKYILSLTIAIHYTLKSSYIFLETFLVVLNSAVRAVTSTSKFSHITPVLKSLHWLKIEQRIHYKLVSFSQNS
jgi:hypothetical protein